MDKEIKKYFNEFKIGTKTMFKEFFNKDTNKKQRANMWTFSRLISPFAAMILSIISILSSNPILYLSLSGIITGLGAATDFFDGRSARKYNSQSEYGKKLDQVTDKIFSIITSINLLFFNLNYIFVIIGEILISSINIYYKKNNPNLNFNSSKIGKLKQWPLFASLGIGFLIPMFSKAINISNILIAITVIMQIITSTNYININEKKIKNILNNKNNNLEENIDNENNEKIKQLEKEKNSNNLEESMNNSKLESYKNLKDILTKMANYKDEAEINTKNNEYKKK